MGELISPYESELIDIIRQDNIEKLKVCISKYKINKKTLIGSPKRTLIQLCAYFGSVNCLEYLITMNFDINELEYENNYSPLYVSCKFNYLEFVFLLLNNPIQKCEILRKSNDGLNEFEVAFLRGNYAICYYLLYGYKTFNNKLEKNLKGNFNDNSAMKLNLKINESKNNEKPKNEYLKFFNDINFTIEKYLGIQEYLLFPLFNMPLFYKSLKQKINPEECPSFEVERKKTKDLLTKIPDPNETWGNFLKRLSRFELYTPPMVDKNSISKANSLYMRTQMKLISMEYGIPIDYCNEKDLIINNFKNDEENEVLNINNETTENKEEDRNVKIINFDENNNRQENENKYFKINLKNNLNSSNSKNKKEKKINNVS